MKRPDPTFGFGIVRLLPSAGMNQIMSFRVRKILSSQPNGAPLAVNTSLFECNSIIA